MPLVALLMLALLYLQFRSVTEALIVLVSVPFALVGSFWTLYLLGYRLSAPVWVGLLSVVGLAMQTGVVMVVYIDEAFSPPRARGAAAQPRRHHRRARRGDRAAAAAQADDHRDDGGRRCCRCCGPQGAGAEIMRRVAAPMIGGLATSAFLTLEVIPVLYTIWRTGSCAARGAFRAPATAYARRAAEPRRREGRVAEETSTSPRESGENSCGAEGAGGRGAGAGIGRAGSAVAAFALNKRPGCGDIWV